MAEIGESVYVQIAHEQTISSATTVWAEDTGGLEFGTICQYLQSNDHRFWLRLM